MLFLAGAALCCDPNVGKVWSRRKLLLHLARSGIIRGMDLSVKKLNVTIIFLLKTGLNTTRIADDE